MKKKITFIITTLFLIVAGCNKEEDLQMPLYYPKPGSPDANVTANRHGQLWAAFGYAQLHSDRPTEYFGLGIITFTEEGFMREKIGLNEIPLQLGNYQVKKKGTSSIYDGYVGAGYHLLAADGDALDDIYDLDEDAESNELEITFIDTVSWVVRGKFNLNFVRKNYPNPNLYYPDKIRFKDGVFEVGFFE